jgi:UDP-2,3-diacylglucosamine pyrophosphatase LpxH
MERTTATRAPGLVFTSCFPLRVSASVASPLVTKPLPSDEANKSFMSGRMTSNWTISSHLKKKVKNAVQFISSFEEVVAHAAHERGANGVVCGHIHSAEIRQIGEVTYYNDGDWVESCTALVEHADGHMEIIDWAERKAREATEQRSERNREATAA